MEDRDAVYSHMNYGILELIVEKIYLRTYPDLMTTNIFEPLGLVNTHVDFKEKKLSILPGQDRSGKVVGPWTFSSFSASEGVRSNAEDLIKFMRCHMQIGNTRFDSIFNEYFDENNPSVNSSTKVSQGWQVVKINKRTSCVLHTGNTSGHSVFLGMQPETKTGVVVLSNSSIGTRDLGLLILRMVNRNWKRKVN